MELAIPTAERTNPAVTTDMDISGTTVKRTGHSNRKNKHFLAETPFTVLEKRGT
jgi:hypothetical protein